MKERSAVTFGGTDVSAARQRIGTGMSAQERTIQQYQELMQLNAVSHLMRAARRLGILDALRQGQQTAEQLCERLSLKPGPAGLLLDSLTATGLIQRYGDDYAISMAGGLLCQYDADLGDARWETLVAQVRGGDAAASTPRPHFDAVAATQWIHTPSAMQAAEILDIGGSGEVGVVAEGIRILDLGCGSAVWSCAMAYRDERSRVLAVDLEAPLQAARSTADSIGLNERFETMIADPTEVELESDAFDWVLIAQRLHAMEAAEGDRLLANAVLATRPGGRVVVIDLFRSPAKPSLAETLAALRMELDTPAGRIPTLEETSRRLTRAGLRNVQFTFLASSREGLGLAVGTKPPPSSLPGNPSAN